MSAPLVSEDVLGSGGILSRRLERFRERAGQLEMAARVADTFVEGGHLIVEAPTGVGKSFAYLVPAILDLIASGKRVVVSTHTIALQEQLLDKDLPVLAACIPVEFVAIKAMGRNNYMSRRRLSVALGNAPTLLRDDAQVRRLNALSSWAEETDEGTRQDLPEAPGAIWEHVRSEADNCLGRSCPTFKSCFFQDARRRLDNADLIVTNHALYFTDLVLRGQDAGILPEHDALVLDEAHQVENVAAERFGLELSRRGLGHFLNRLTAGHGGPGILHRFEGERVLKVRELVRKLGALQIDFFRSLADWLESHPASHARIREPQCVEDLLSTPLTELGLLLEEQAVDCRNENEEIEVRSAASRALLLADTSKSLLDMDDPDLVYFVEGERSLRDMALVGPPLDVGPLLAQNLFNRVRSVVLTSATMGSGSGTRGLAYTAGRLGCPEAECLVLDTPFDFKSKVEVLVPAKLPFPDEPGFDEAAANAIVELVRESGGGAFVLFTSYRALEACHRLVLEPLTRAGLKVLRQGATMDRRTLLDVFRRDGNAVLLGADSFWEGVDVPGPALRLVIITRLPFPVPTLPLHAARAEAIKLKGGSPFGSYFLPEAVIRFRQGFGRLVRTEEDGGRVVCLDRRVVMRPYGRVFQRSVPEAPWREVPAPQQGET